jgi:hypothetical protein
MGECWHSATGKRVTLGRRQRLALQRPHGSEPLKGKQHFGSAILALGMERADCQAGSKASDICFYFLLEGASPRLKRRLHIHTRLTAWCTWVWVSVGSFCAQSCCHTSDGVPALLLPMACYAIWVSGLV